MLIGDAINLFMPNFNKIVKVPKLTNKPEEPTAQNFINVFLFLICREISLIILERLILNKFFKKISELNFTFINLNIVAIALCGKFD